MAPFAFSMNACHTGAPAEVAATVQAGVLEQKSSSSARRCAAVTMTAAGVRADHAMSARGGHRRSITGLPAPIFTTSRPCEHGGGRQVSPMPIKTILKTMARSTACGCATTSGVVGLPVDDDLRHRVSARYLYQPLVWNYAGWPIPDYIIVERPTSRWPESSTSTPSACSRVSATARGALVEP